MFLIGLVLFFPFNKNTFLFIFASIQNFQEYPWFFFFKFLLKPVTKKLLTIQWQ